MIFLFYNSALFQIGALLKTCRGRKNISDGDITFLGIVMASLPLDVCLSKMIVLGHMFSVLHDAIIIGNKQTLSLNKIV